MAVLSLVAVIAASCERTAPNDDPTSPAGPGVLVINNAAEFGVGIRVNAGAPYSFSELYLRNQGNEPVTITDVRLIDPKGIALVGAMVGLPTGPDGGPTGGPGFPLHVRYPLQPALGYEVLPEGQLGFFGQQLIVGLRAEADGISTTQGYEVTYKDSAGHEFTAIERYRTALCAPISYWAGPKHVCVAPDPE